MTFEELRIAAQKIYKEVLTAEEERKNDKTIERLAELYNEAYVDEKRRERDTEFREFVAERADALKATAVSVIAEKRLTVEKMLVTPPTPEQLNLLTAIQLRGADVSKTEFYNLVAQLTPNYQAAKTLQALAEKSGAHITLPERCDYEDLKAHLDWTENYLNERIHSLRNFTTTRALHPFDRLFFGEGWRDPHYDTHAVALFD